MEKEHKTNLRKMEHKRNVNKIKIRNCLLTYLKKNDSEAIHTHKTKQIEL